MAQRSRGLVEGWSKARCVGSVYRVGREERGNVGESGKAKERVEGEVLDEGCMWCGGVLRTRPDLDLRRLILIPAQHFVPVPYI